jgi:hypothetical protein
VLYVDFYFWHSPLEKLQGIAEKTEGKLPVKMKHPGKYRICGTFHEGSIFYGDS